MTIFIPTTYMEYYRFCDYKHIIWLYASKRLMYSTLFIIFMCCLHIYNACVLKRLRGGHIL